VDQLSDPCDHRCRLIKTYGDGAQIKAVFPSHKIWGVAAEGANERTRDEIRHTHRAVVWHAGPMRLTPAIRKPPKMGL